MKSAELREKTDDELAQILKERSEDLMYYRLQLATGALDNVRSSRNARREIARVKTILAERNRAAQTADAGDKK